MAEDRQNWHKMPTDAEFSTMKVVIINIHKPLSLTDALSSEKQVTTSAKQRRKCQQSIRNVATSYCKSTHDTSKESTVRLSAEPEDSAVNNPKRLKGLAAVLKHIKQEEGLTYTFTVD